jgi:hypothetical protein
MGRLKALIHDNALKLSWKWIKRLTFVEFLLKTLLSAMMAVCSKKQTNLDYILCM